MQRPLRSLLTVVVLATLGCAAPAAVVVPLSPEETNLPVLAHLSAGHVGCPPEDISVSKYQLTRLERDVGERPVVESWAVSCRGATFVCSAGRGRELACSPERSK